MKLADLNITLPQEAHPAKPPKGQKHRFLIWTRVAPRFLHLEVQDLAVRRDGVQLDRIDVLGGDGVQVIVEPIEREGWLDPRKGRERDRRR